VALVANQLALLVHRTIRSILWTLRHREPRSYVLAGRRAGRRRAGRRAGLRWAGLHVHTVVVHTVVAHSTALAAQEPAWGIHVVAVHRSAVLERESVVLEHASAVLEHTSAEPCPGLAAA